MILNKKVLVKIQLGKTGLDKKILNKLKNKKIKPNDLQEFFSDRQDNYDDSYTMAIDTQIDNETGCCHTGWNVDKIKTIKESKDSFQVSFIIDVDLEVDLEEKPVKETKKKNKEFSK